MHQALTPPRAPRRAVEVSVETLPSPEEPRLESIAQSITPTPPRPRVDSKDRQDNLESAVPPLPAAPPMPTRYLQQDSSPAIGSSDLSAATFHRSASKETPIRDRPASSAVASAA